MEPTTIPTTRRVNLHARFMDPETATTIAARPDVIAVFVYRIDAADHHVGIECHKDFKTWSAIVRAFIEAARLTLLVDRPVWMRIDDAQAIRYVRSARHAIVIVTPQGSPYHKTVSRTVRGILKRLDVAARAEGAAS